jgi:hypothetical protein
MKFASKIVGLCLVGTLIAALMPAMFVTDAWADAYRAGPIEGAAGCHGQGGSQPPHLPTPSSYRCCMTGHDAAVVQASQSLQPMAQCARVAAHVESGTVEVVLAGVEGSIVRSADPPGRSPLRI